MYDPFKGMKPLPHNFWVWSLAMKRRFIVEMETQLKEQFQFSQSELEGIKEKAAGRHDDELKKCHAIAGALNYRLQRVKDQQPKPLGHKQVERVVKLIDRGYKPQFMRDGNGWRGGEKRTVAEVFKEAKKKYPAIKLEKIIVGGQEMDVINYGTTGPENDGGPDDGASPF